MKNFPTADDRALFKPSMNFFGFDISVFESKEIFIKKIFENYRLEYTEDNLTLLEKGFLNDVFNLIANTIQTSS